MRKSSDYIYTQSGHVFLPEELKAEHIVLEDIAFGLSRIYRFNGQTAISVLRHSIGLSSCFDSPAQQYLALFHDATEAYLMDVPVPLKKYMNQEWHKEYQRIETLIFQKFGVPHDAFTALEIDKMDKRIIEYEMEAHDSSMKYPDSHKMHPGIKRELHDAYKWHLNDRYLPCKWLDMVEELAVQERYFSPVTAL